MLPRAVGVGVSGGADSVALLRLLARNAEGTSRRLLVIHLNHQLRGDASDADEQFVRALAGSLGLPIHMRRRADLEPEAPSLPRNPSARYRALRNMLYRQAMRHHELEAVAVAHHAGDQAETVFLRLVRGAGWMGLGGMLPHTCVGGVPIVRPLLDCPAEALRRYLVEIHQPWREDASNASPRYQRNTVRRILAGNPRLSAALCDLARRARALRSALDQAAPALPEQFDRSALHCPSIIAEHAARQWLVARGGDPDDISPAAVARLVRQAIDPTAPARQHYPGGVWVRRRAGKIFADHPPGAGA